VIVIIRVIVRRVGLFAMAKAMCLDGETPGRVGFEVPFDRRIGLERGLDVVTV
jgi:hypothetical protein